MSKRSLFWGNASGKLGEAVLYRAGGEQRARTYVKNVKNPRTRAQMLNRVSMGNLSSFFRANASLLRQSFTNRPANQSGFNAFVKASKNASSAAIPHAAALQGYNIPVGLAASRGILPITTAHKLVTYTDGNKQYAAIAVLPVGRYEEFSGDAFISTPAANFTLEQTLADSMNASNFIVDENIPSKFSICAVISEYADDGFRSTPHRLELSWNSSTKTFTAVDGSNVATIYGTTPFCKITDAQGNVYIGVASANGNDAGNGALYAAGFVAMRDANGKINCSPSDMMFVLGDEDYADQWLEGGALYNETLNDLGVGASSIV